MDYVFSKYLLILPKSLSHLLVATINFMLASPTKENRLPSYMLQGSINANYCKQQNFTKALI